MWFRDGMIVSVAAIAKVVIVVYVSCSFVATFSVLAAPDSCTLCQDGSDILYPDAMIDETEQTCAELQEEAAYFSDAVSCRYYHRYGNKCGCNNTPPQETFCELCQDSSEKVPDPDLWLEGYDESCGILQEDAAWNLWHTFEDQTADMKDDDNMDEKNVNCNYYHHVGSLCGCKHNKPPSNGCDLCLDGNEPTMPQKRVTPGNAAEATCAAFSLFTSYIHTQGSTECEKYQSVLGSYCGCSETPKDAPTCDFCPTGLVTTDGWAPDIALKMDEDKRVFYFRDAACIKVVMLASEFDFPCTDIPADFVDACCEPALDLLGPQVFEQGKGPASQQAAQQEQQGKAPEPLGNQVLEPLKLNWDEFIFLSAAPKARNIPISLRLCVGISILLALLV